LLLLFVSSHGESFGRRTAFLLEDYGSDDDDITSGMSEIEQFVEALSNVDPKNQLLIFDCCRTPTSLGLRFDQEFGTRLINPGVAGGDVARRPHVLRSTGLGAEAYGKKDSPTLFTLSLLEALRGLAASPNDRWAINTYDLGHTAARLLGLHVRDGEPLQDSEIQLAKPLRVRRSTTRGDSPARRRCGGVAARGAGVAHSVCQERHVASQIRRVEADPHQDRLDRH
jgi:hypothetical protein